MVALDFFNSTAAICVVVVFAKFVTHRTRNAESNPAIAVHGFCLTLAAIGLVSALIGTETESNWTTLHRLVWVGTLGSTALLLADAGWDDLTKHRRRVRGPSSEAWRDDRPAR